MAWSQMIAETAARYGQDPDVANRIVAIESGHNPNAQNKNSTAGGFFQFIDGTWKGYSNGKPKLDPYANADGGVRLMRDNREGLKKFLGREPQGWELYLAHQQGLGGAKKLLRDPNARAMDVVGASAVRNNLPRDSGIDPANATAGQLAGVWQAKFEGAKYEGGSGPTVDGAGEGSNAYTSAVMGQLSDKPMVFGDDGDGDVDLDPNADLDSVRRYGKDEGMVGSQRPEGKLGAYMRAVLNQGPMASTAVAGDGWL